MGSTVLAENTGTVPIHPYVQELKATNGVFGTMAPDVDEGEV